MNQNISRRSLARGAAWSVPVVVAASAVPAYAVSCTVAWTVSVTNTANTGAAGAAGTVSFWVVVTPKTAAQATCKTTKTVTTNVLRQAPTSTTGRWRTMSLGQGNPVIVTVKATIDGNQGAQDVQTPGEIDYQWQITFDPSRVYTMADHRFYVTISSGDGGIPRIYNSLQVIADGSVKGSLARF